MAKRTHASYVAAGKKGAKNRTRASYVAAAKKGAKTKKKKNN